MCPFPASSQHSSSDKHFSSHIRTLQAASLHITVKVEKYLCIKHFSRAHLFEQRTAEFFSMVDCNAVPERGQGSSTKSYARWSPEDTRPFIAACEIAIFEGLRNGLCFTKHGWERVSTLFNSVTDHNWKKQQLRNHCDTIWRAYRCFAELLNCNGIEYNPSTGRIVASEEWWKRKLKNKEYKDFKNKDVSKIYIKYYQIFGDSFDGDKYAMTPTKLCRTSFSLFKDSALEDHRDSIPVDVESSGLSDEAEEVHGSQACMPPAARTAAKESPPAVRDGARKKLTARELSFLVDWATSAAEEVAAKMNTIMTANDNACTECTEELLAIGGLECGTPLYFFACTVFAQKRYRDMLRVMEDTDEKMN